METILTVLSTIGVGALAYAFAGVIRLSRRVNDLELVRMEMDDMENRFNKGLEMEIQDRELSDKEVHTRLDQDASSIDRRTDKLWEVWHNLDDKVKQLDTTINPNMDKIK
tara:strand:- start:1582 stop:1911 length:330 start_codon:yes stop_codon:yes gene_type:complete